MSTTDERDTRSCLANVDNGVVSGPDLQRAAERVVSDHFDGDVSLRIEHLVPDRLFSVVARLRTIGGPSHVPETFVIKAATPGQPTSAEQTLNDWAALQLLTELSAGEVPLAPRYYGGDRSIPLVVMEDLGGGDGSPDLVVERDDPDAATESLLEYVRTVARLHVQTMGHHERHSRLRRSIGPPPPVARLYHDPWSDATARTDSEISDAIREYHEVLDGVGVSADPGVDEEIDAATRRVEHDPRPWLALCQGDQNGQGNSLLRDGRLRLHDFGSGGFRHALIEALPHRITWGCIRRVPDPVATAMDAAYRAVLAETYPSMATEPGYSQAAADAMTRWHVFHVISRVPDALQGDRPRGPATLRQQTLAWLDAYACWSDQQDREGALARTAHRLVERLRQQWPPATHTIDYLPAYRDKNVRTDAAGRSI